MLSTDDDDMYQELQRKYKTVAVTLTQSREFMAMVCISYVAKSPLTGFMTWAQKEVGIYNKNAGKAKADGSTYLGS